MARNFLGGFNQPGKPLLLCVREEIVDLYNNGIRVSEISCNTEVTKGALHKVVQTLCPPQHNAGIFLWSAVSLTVDLPEVIEIWELQKPSLYASEIREKLLRE